MALTPEHKERLQQIEKTLKDHPFPPQIIIETTSRCNFRCHHCAHDIMKRKEADMDPVLWRKIIDEISGISRDTEIWPAFYGEPFLLGEQFFSLLSYAHEKGCNNIHVNTNGSMLHHQRIRDAILDSSIRCLFISLDAFTSDTFGKIRRGGNRDQIFAGVESLLRERETRGQKYPLIICQFVLMDENRDEVEEFRSFWLERGADVKIRNVGSWTGAVTASYLDYEEEFRIACPIGNNTMAIHQDGNVAACCADYEGGFIAGNIHDQSIEEIWNGSLNEHLRKPFKEHRWNDIPGVCKKCRDWQICGAEYVSRNTEHRKDYPFWQR